MPDVYNPTTLGNSRMRTWTIVFLVALTTFAGCRCSRNSSETVVMLAAASTAEAVEEIGKSIAVRPGIDLKPSFASSATLAQQITAGAEAHVFLSASVEWADELEKAGLVAQRHDILSNRLVVVVPGDSKLAVANPEDLLQNGIERLAMGDPTHVPAGKYAKSMLTRLGLWDRLESRVVAGSDVRQALFFVERGEADAGIVYATDAIVAKDLRVAFTFEPELGEPITYTLVLLKEGEKSPAAQKVYADFQSPSADEIFLRRGFIIDAP